MPSKWIPYVKVLVHAWCLTPALLVVYSYRSGKLALQADPVSWISHWTGDWTLWMLLISLAVTPVRRLHPRLSNLIRFRRMLGLYAFFYALLHLSSYVFLFSGFDLPTALAGLRQGHLGVVWTQWLAVWPGVLDDLKHRRLYQVGLFGWIILLLLAVTSPVVVLRTMGGKDWQRLHRLVYFAGAAGCLHYWLLVKKGVRTPLPDTVVLGVLLLARVGWLVWKRVGRDKAVKRVVARSV